MFLVLMFLISGCIGGSMEVKKGDFVKVHYTGKLDNGDVFDSSEGKEPLEFEAGAGQMIEGFDTAVIGMKVGEKKTITLEPEKAYGEIRDDLIQDVDMSRFGEQEVKVGDDITAYTVEGYPIQGVVLEVSDQGAKVDFNHKLAGKKLIFDIEIVDIEKQ